MKTKLIILAFAIFSSSLLIAQPVSHESKTNCEKKVLNKIKRKMNNLDVKDYLNEGSKTIVIVTCFINEENKVEVAKITSYSPKLSEDIITTLKDHPVTCDSESTGEYFTFKLVFKHLPVS